MNAAAQADGTAVNHSGAQLYRSFCAGCHGVDLQGGLGPSLVRDQWRFGGDDESIARTIRDGRAEVGMPPMGQALDDDDLRELILFLRAQIAGAASIRMNPPSPEPERAVASELHRFRVEPVTDALETPWSIAFLPDGSMLVTEKEGRLRLLDRDGLRAPITGTPEVWHVGQGGLLDVAVHPRHAENGWIYLTYAQSSARDSGTIAVERGRIHAGAWVDREVLFAAESAHMRPGGAQFGSRLAFDDGAHVYFSVGDRDFPDDAQDLLRPNGKIHRIHDDGRVPTDNPFAGRDDALPSIWTLGHRNPQGLARHPITRELWSTEHGPRGGDELNRIEPGCNYGWPRITYGTNYDGTTISEHTWADGLEQPAIYWTPSLGVCALHVYTGDAFPRWRHHFFMTSLVREELRRLEIAYGRVVHEEVILHDRGRVRDVATGPDGRLYVVLNQPDRIIRLVPEEASSHGDS